MRYYAYTLAEKSIRVNSVHPGAVATPMIQNEETEQFMARFRSGRHTLKIYYRWAPSNR